MTKIEPTIQKYMTYLPHSIQAKASIKDAIDEMERLKIRHLPVIEDGKIVGIISDRDIKLATSFVGTDAALINIKDICHEHPYQVEPNSLLKEVASEMASKRYGSALVIQNGHLVGIFTTVDVCRALYDVIDQRFHGQ